MSTASPSARPRVLIVEADLATFELFDEWLAADGLQAVDGRRGAPVGTASAAARQRCDVALVDVPFPRDEGVELLRGVAAENPGTPILALSSQFFANVACSGPCARQFGVAGVLPKPVSREALITAVRALLPFR
ncbi:MAG: response regulator [Gammaproteobacteria bacterium]